MKASLRDDSLITEFSIFIPLLKVTAFVF